MTREKKKRNNYSDNYNVKKVSEEVDITKEEAKELLDKFNKTYPKLKNFRQ